MEKNTTDFFSEQFSEDPQENLRIENEILHLTIKAELGGEIMHHTQVPIEVENEVLKNILAYEHAFNNAREIKVIDLLGRPAYKKAVELTEDELPAALEGIITLLTAHDISVEYLADYDDRLKYTFITEELFEHETNDVQIPGMISHFWYEDFHPNHRIDIEDLARGFISNWFEHDSSDYLWSLVNACKLPDGSVISKEEVIDRILRAYDAYPVFKEYNYELNDILFEFREEDGTGVGRAEGTLEYTAILESGEQIDVSGPFKFHVCREHHCWRIYCFVFPGFSWV